MDSPAEFVARYAPDLVGAAEARDGSEPQARVDAEVVRSLTELWIAGPPYEPAVDRCRRRLAVGGGDLVDLDDVPKIIGRAQLGPERLDRLTAGVRQRLARHDQLPRRRRLLVGAGAAVAMVLIAITLRVPAASERPTVAPPPPLPAASSSANRGPVGGYGPIRPHQGLAVEAETWRAWMSGIRTSVFGHLDPTGELLGPQAGQPSLFAEDGPEGLRVFALFGRVLETPRVIGAPYGRPRNDVDLRVLLIAGTNPSLLSVCGYASDLTCKRQTMPDGGRLWVASDLTRVEVVHRFEERSWVYVRVDSMRPGLIDVDEVIELAQDRRVALPR